MSTPTPPRPSPAHPTLQQLDELEILMQRMLALPVSPSTEGPEEPAEPPAQRPAPPPAAQATPLPTTLRTPPQPSGEVVSTPAAAATTLEPRIDEPVVTAPATASEAEQHSSSAASSPLESPFTVPPLEVTVGQWLPPGKRPRSAANRRRSLVVPWRRPLVWSNRLFDRWALQHGRGPGRWLRGPQGRALLGWTGLLLLATALVWGVLDWIGWTR